MRTVLLRVLAAGLIVAVIGLPAAAQADAVAKSDPRRDAPAHLDITRVTYRNASHVAGATIKIPQLQRRGQVSVAMGVPNSDVGYFAIIRVRDDGSLAKRLMYSTAAEWRRVSCRVAARWKTADGLVRVSVPQTCLKALRGTPAYYMFARTGGRSGDVAPAAQHLRRG